MPTGIRTALAALLALAVASPVAAQDFAKALTEGSAAVSLRYRLETVDQDAFEENAVASTLLGRLHYDSAVHEGWSVAVEFDAVVAFGGKKYNSGAGTSGPERDIYPVIADPEFTELNQLYLQYDDIQDSTIRVGRQRINLDNQRFIGGVAWRQNEQTYDALTIVNTSLEATTLEYGFIHNVNRIFGEDGIGGDHQSSTHLLNARRAFNELGAITGYYYAIDNKDAASFSTETLGLRFVGQNKSLLNREITYTVEYATQRDASNNPVDFRANYWHLEVDSKIGSVSPFVGLELLGADADVQVGGAFRTPLATLHAFNGWADKFLTTPDDGLQDIFIGAKGTFGGLDWRALWHDFSADRGSERFGGEFDISVNKRVGAHYSLLLKFARFFADSDRYDDTTKAWIMAGAEF